MIRFALPALADKEQLVAELQVALGQHRISMGDDVALGLDESQRAAAQAVIDAHAPTTKTLARVNAEPHSALLTQELNAAGLAGVGIQLPRAYPGDLVLTHAPATPAQQSAARSAAAAHDPSLGPAPRPVINQDTFQRAVAKAARGKALTAAEAAELDKAENLP